MIGERQVDQGSLFHEFSLERHVPAYHPLKAIDRFVDLGDLRARFDAILQFSSMRTSTIAMSITRFAPARQPDRVFDKDSQASSSGQRAAPGRKPLFGT